MPELPEVEVVRRGLARHVEGRQLLAVQVLHPRAVRRHVAGADDFVGALTGRRVAAIRRRGKYLWWAFDDGDALLAHLGMSGQFRIAEPAAPTGTEPRVVHPHLRVRFDLDGGTAVEFLDQRTFGGMAFAPGGAELPAPLAHIAPDLLDPAFDTEAVVTAVRRKNSEIKRVLLDQTVVSGIGNIYADEALWRARVHYARPAAGLSRPVVRLLLASAREVMLEALAQGGTSFDSLYVNVNGQSGYFSRSLAAYGQQDRPCPRCGTPIRREPFMNRSSFLCPRCQRPPRTRQVGR